MNVQTGLDLFEKKWPRKLKGARVGLLAHNASRNRRFVHAINLLRLSKKFEFKAIFGPQHGIFGETQANMIEWEGFRDSKTGLPVFSLYSHTRKPKPEMLKDIDVIIIDLQEIGSRYYTYIWTMDLCMEACKEMNKSIVILDRPNPIGGQITEGTVLDVLFVSFVGRRPLPVRHAMTIGEIGLYLQNEFYPSLDLYVIPMKGWRRKMWFNESGLPWFMPSPNVPTMDTAVVYPGMCLLEGTNISEGRGTTRPFEIFGAPFIEPDILIKEINKLNLPGIVLTPLIFQPTFQKYKDILCKGAQIHIINKNTFKPFKTGVAIIKKIFDLYPEHFAWEQPPYEYEKEKLPIDILAGTNRIRKDIEKGEDLNRMEEWWQKQCMEFNKKYRKKYLIY